MILRIFIALILSIIATIVLFFGAGMLGGMCHCMDSMFSIFPYGTYVIMHFSSDSLGLPLTLIQFPAYVLLVMLVKGVRWKLGVALFLIVLHIAAASFALHDYCQSRRTCFLWRTPTSVSTSVSMRRLKQHPVRGAMFIAAGSRCQAHSFRSAMVYGRSSARTIGMEFLEPDMSLLKECVTSYWRGSINIALLGECT